jgi:undecaprenyl-diphosphatase
VLTPLLVLLVVFGVMAIGVRSAAAGRIDQWVTRRFQELRLPGLETLARGLTRLGETPVMVTIGVAVAAVLLATGRPWAALFAAAGLLGMPIAGGIKLLVRRPRPDSKLVDVVLPTVGLSFPSGHALSAVTFWGFVAVVAWQELAGVSSIVAVVTAVLLITGISLSRIYLGAHWLSDVIGGITGGILILIVTVAAYQMVVLN